MAPPKPRTDLARASARASKWAFGTKGQSDKQHAAALKNYEYIQDRLRETGGEQTDTELGIGQKWLTKPPPKPIPVPKASVPGRYMGEAVSEAGERARERNIARGALPTGGMGRAERERFRKALEGAKGDKQKSKVLLEQLGKAGFETPPATAKTKAEADAYNKQATASLHSFLKAYRGSERAARVAAISQPFNFKRNVSLIGRQDAQKIYGVAMRAHSQLDPMRPVGGPAPNDWAHRAVRWWDDHMVSDSEKKVRAALLPDWVTGTAQDDLKELVANTALSIPAIGEVIVNDFTGKTRLGIPKTIYQIGKGWAQAVEEGVPADLYTLGKAAIQGDPSVITKDLKQAKEAWTEHPFTTALNVIPGANALLRGPSIGILARRIALENPELTPLQVLRAARKESYSPGWAAMTKTKGWAKGMEIKGGIPDRVFRGKIIDDLGHERGDFEAPAKTPSRTVLGRAATRAGMAAGRSPVLGLGPFSETSRAAAALRRVRGMAWERKRLAAMQLLGPIEKYIRQSSLTDEVKNRLLNRVDENRTRMVEIFYGPQLPDKLGPVEGLQAVGADLKAILEEGGIDIPTEKLGALDKELGKLNAGLEKLGLDINYQDGLWAEGINTMRKTGMPENQIYGLMEIVAARARAWAAEDRVNRHPQDYLESPEGRNLAGFRFGTPDAELAQTLYQTLFPDEKPTSPLRPTSEDQIKNRNRAVHVRALRRGKAKWQELLPDGVTKRERNVSHAQQGLSFKNEATAGPDGKPLFGQETAYEDLIPRWEQGYREAFPDATEAEIRQAMLDSAAFYEEKVFPYLGRVMNSREVQAWLASQKGASPERGLLDLTKAIERAMLREPIGSRDIGLASQTMARIIYGEIDIAEGAAAKLTDFSDVGHAHTATRTFVNHDPEAGVPYVSDRWEARAQGLVDADHIETLYRRFGDTLQKQGYIAYEDWKGLRKQASDEATAWKAAEEAKKKKVSMAQRDQERDRRLRGLEQEWTKKTGQKTIVPDMGTGLTAVQYEHVSDWGAGLVDYLNEVEYLGKTDWNAASGQALDWAGYQHYVGVHPENVDWALLRQERVTTFDLPSSGRLAKKFPELASLDAEAQMAITKYVADTIIDTAAQRSGAIPIRTTVGYGGLATVVSPSVRSGVLGANRVFRAYMDNVRDLLDAEDVWGAEGAAGVHTQLTLGAPELLDPDLLHRFWTELADAHPELSGFMPTEEGGLASILVHPDGTAVARTQAYQTAVIATIQRLERELGISDTQVSWAAFGSFARSTREQGALDAHVAEQLARPESARSPEFRGRSADARGPEARLRATAADRRTVDDKVAEALELYKAEGTAGVEAQARVSGRINDPEARPATTRVTKTGKLKWGDPDAWAKGGKVAGRKLILHQADPVGIKGAVQFLDTETGQQMVWMSEHADGSTFLHEMFGHAAGEMKRGYPTEFAALEKRYGKAYEDWTEVEHEKFARETERYFMSGKAPIPELQPLFDNARKWMYHVYETIKALGRPIHPETRYLLDRYFGKDPLEFEAPKRITRKMPGTTDDAGITKLVRETSEMLTRRLDADPARRLRIGGNMKWLEEQVLPFMKDTLDPVTAAKVHDLFTQFEEVKRGKSIFTPEEQALLRRRGETLHARYRELDNMSTRLASQPDQAAMQMARDVMDALDDPDLDLEGLERAVTELQDAGYDFDRRRGPNDEHLKLLSRQVKDIERALKSPRNKAERDAAIGAMREISSEMKKIYLEVFGENLTPEEYAQLERTLRDRDNLLPTRLRELGLIDEGTGDAHYVPHYSIFDVISTRMRGAVRLPAAGRSRKTLSLKPRADSSVFSKGMNKLIRYQTGELALDPRALFYAYKNRLRFVETSMLRKELFDIGVPIDRSVEGGRVPRGWYIINGSGKHVPERLLAWQRSTPEQMDEMLASGEDFDSLLSSEEGINQTLDEYRKSFLHLSPNGEIPRHWDPSDELRMVPPEIVEKMVGKVFESAPGGKVAATTALFGTMGRFATIYAHPVGYIGANVAANTMMLGMTHPGQLLRALREFAKVPGRLGSTHPELYERITTETGDVLAEAGIPDFYVKPQGRLEALSQAGADLSGRWAGTLGRIADQPFRVAAWVGEARRYGFTDVDDWERLLNDPELEGIRNTVAQRARDSMLDFNKLSPSEKVAARWLFIWPFVKASAAWPFYMLREYPGRLAAVAGVADAQTEAYEGTGIKSAKQRYNEMAPAKDRSMFDIGQVPMFGGTVNLSPINPIQPLAEKVIDTGKLMGGDFSVIGQLLNPSFRESGGVIFGDGKVDWEKVAGATVPGMSFVNAWRHPKARGAQVYTDRDSFWDYLRRREGRFFPEDVSAEKVQEAGKKERDRSDKRPAWEKSYDEDLATLDKIVKYGNEHGDPEDPERTRLIKKSITAYNALDRYEADVKEQTGKSELDEHDKLEATYRVVQDFYPEHMSDWPPLEETKSWPEKSRAENVNDVHTLRMKMRDAIGGRWSQAKSKGRDWGVVE